MVFRGISVTTAKETMHMDYTKKTKPHTQPTPLTSTQQFHNNHFLKEGVQWAEEPTWSSISIKVTPPPTVMVKCHLHAQAHKPLCCVVFFFLKKTHTTPLFLAGQ